MLYLVTVSKPRSRIYQNFKNIFDFEHIFLFQHVSCLGTLVRLQFSLTFHTKSLITSWSMSPIFTMGHGIFKDLRNLRQISLNFVAWFWKLCEITREFCGKIRKFAKTCVCYAIVDFLAFPCQNFSNFTILCSITMI